MRNSLVASAQAATALCIYSFVRIYCLEGYHCAPIR